MRIYTRKDENGTHSLFVCLVFAVSEVCALIIILITTSSSSWKERGKHVFEIHLPCLYATV